MFEIFTFLAVICTCFLNILCEGVQIFCTNILQISFGYVFYIFQYLTDVLLTTRSSVRFATFLLAPAVG